MGFHRFYRELSEKNKQYIKKRDDDLDKRLLFDMFRLSTLDSSLTSPHKQQTILWVRNSCKTTAGRRPFLLLLLLLSLSIEGEFWLLLWTGRVSGFLSGRYSGLLEARFVLVGRLEGVLLGKPVGVVSVILKRRCLGGGEDDLGKYYPIALDRELRRSRSRSGFLPTLQKKTTVIELMGRSNPFPRSGRFERRWIEISLLLLLF